MRIAVNTRFLLPDYLEGYGYFLQEMLQRIIKNHPEHQFIFIFDRPYADRFVFGSNVTPVVAGPPARHPLLWKWWYDVKVPAILRKYKADVFVSTDGFCSLATRRPQLLVVHDLSFLHFPDLIHKSHLFFYKRFTPRFLERAKRVVTVSEFSRRDLLNNYAIDAEKITVIPNAAREGFHVLSDEEKEQTREAFTEGKNYFLYAGSIHPRKNLHQLLKAFSIFKKRQRSEWKLVLAGRLAWKNEAFLQSLKSYKYRSDVVLTGYVTDEDMQRLMGAAYALVYPSRWEGFGVPVLEAMASGVPVITSEQSAMQEIAGKAAYYVDPTKPAEIAEGMMELYRNESLAARMIGEGKRVAESYSWDKTAEAFFEEILQAAGKKS